MPLVYEYPSTYCLDVTDWKKVEFAIKNANGELIESEIIEVPEEWTPDEIRKECDEWVTQFNHIPSYTYSYRQL